MRRIWIIVVLLASFYTSSTRAQQCADDLFRPLPAQPAYNGLAPTYDAIGGLNWWYNIAEMFVDELWPDLPYEEGLNLINTTVELGPMIADSSLDWGKAVVALFILGLLLAVSVPIAGICICCCRCCGFCGGNYMWSYTRDHSYRSKRAWCACITLTIVTVLLIMTVFAGLVVAYISNTNARVAVSDTPETVDSALEDLQTYLATLQRDVEFVGLEQYGVTTDCVVESVSDSFTSVLDRVAQDLNVDGALNLADQAVTDVNALSMLLTRVQSNIVQLNMTERMLRAELTSIDGNLTAIMNDPVCNMSGCGSLTLDISAFNDATSMVPDIKPALMDANNTLHGYDVRTFISSARMDLNMTLHNISLQVGEMKQDVSDLLKGTVQDSVNSSIGQLSRSLTAAVTAIEHIRNITRHLFSSVATLPHGPTTYLSIANDTRFALGLCFCAILTLILLLAIAGLLCGSGGIIMGGIYPPSRKRLADCGGRSLLAASGCMFVWWFLLMLVVTFAFLFGAILQIPCDEVKHPSYNGLAKTLDDPEASRRVIGGEFGMLLQMDEVSFREMLIACSQNQSLYRATKLDRILLPFGIDLNGLISNATTLIEELQANTTASISATSVVGTVTFLSGTTLMELMNIQNFSLSSVNVTGVEAGYASVLGTIDLEMLLKSLEGLQNTCSNRSDVCMVGMELNESISSVKRASAAEDSIMQLASNLSSEFSAAQSLAVNTSETVGMLIEAAMEANASLSNATAIKASAKAYVSELFGIGVQYIEYLNTTLVESVAPCYAPWAAAVGTTSLICTGIVGSLNAYWFALGWSLLWSLPLIVFMIWLAGYFVKYKEDIPKSPEEIQMSEMLTSQATTGTIIEHEMSAEARRPKVYYYPGGGVEVHGVANVSLDEEAEVHRNVMARETAQINVPEEAAAITVREEGEAEVEPSLLTVNTHKFYDRRAQSYVYTNRFTMEDVQREKKRLTPPPDYFTMYPRESRRDGSGPRIVVHEQGETTEDEVTWQS